MRRPAAVERVKDSIWGRCHVVGPADAPGRLGRRRLPGRKEASHGGRKTPEWRTAREASRLSTIWVRSGGQLSGSPRRADGTPVPHGVLTDPRHAAAGAAPDAGGLIGRYTGRRANEPDAASSNGARSNVKISLD